MNLEAILYLIICFCLINKNSGKVHKKKPHKKNGKGKNYMKKPPLITTRIVGGYVTTIQDIGGYLVAMRYNEQFACGGSLLTEWFVVSAAHCVDGKMKNIDKITIEGGISSLNENAIRVSVSKVIYPSSFNAGTYHNDVSILKLSKPLIGNDIKTIDLCSHQPKIGNIATISGWGSLKSGGPHTTEVYSVEVPIISKRKCAKMYLNRYEITSSMLCAGVLGHKDSCHGDSGGPLVIQGELCGIVSFGIGCADSEFPGIYTDINFVHTFIENALERL